MRIVIPFAAYLLCGFSTFGHVYNHYECAYRDMPRSCNGDRQMWSVFSGALWPIYWSGRLAIEVTKP